MGKRKSTADAGSSRPKRQQTNVSHRQNLVAMPEIDTLPFDVEAITASITRNVTEAVLAGLQAQGLPVGVNSSATTTGPVQPVEVIPTTCVTAGQVNNVDTVDSARNETLPRLSTDRTNQVAGIHIPQTCSTGKRQTYGNSSELPSSQFFPHIERLLNASLAPSSKVTYKKAWLLFSEFAHHQGFQPFSRDISPVHMALFVAYLYHLQCAPRTISTYLSAVAYVYKVLHNIDPADNFLVKKLVSGAYRLAPTLDVRLPITVPILDKLIDALCHLSQNLFEKTLFQAMFLFAFNAFTRVGEITGNPDSANLVKFEHITITNSNGKQNVQVRFYNFKHNLDRTCHNISFGHGPTKVSAVTALSSYLGYRSNAQGPLFTLLNGRPVPRPYFDKQLHACLAFCKLDSSVYKGHSFRIGAASHAAVKGLSDAHIRSLGRWKSNAFKKYIRSSSS